MAEEAPHSTAGSAQAGLYRKESDASAPVMLVYLDGATDAGAASQLALHQILSALPVRRVATFNADEFVDYRSRRPVVLADGWVPTEVSFPYIHLDLVTDYGGQELLILHGVEPDFRWRAFTRAVEELARDCGVQRVIDILAMPAMTPHTRMPFIQVMSPDADLVPENQIDINAKGFAASINLCLEQVLAEAGFSTIGFLVAVPFYLAETEYPPAAVALLEKLSAEAGIELPVGDLVAFGEQQRKRADQAVAMGGDLAQMVANFEQHYDAAQARGEFQVAAPQTESITGEAIAQRLEEFLRLNDIYLDQAQAHRRGQGGAGTEFNYFEVPPALMTEAAMLRIDETELERGGGVGPGAEAGAGKAATPPTPSTPTPSTPPAAVRTEGAVPRRGEHPERAEAQAEAAAEKQPFPPRRMRRRQAQRHFDELDERDQPGNIPPRTRRGRHSKPEPEADGEARA